MVLLLGSSAAECVIMFAQEGLKKLNVLLDSNEFLQALDDNTLATPAGGKIKGTLSPCHISATCCQLSDQPNLQSVCVSMVPVAVGTWPGLCVTLVEYAATEVTASIGKKKGPDAAIPKALRRFVQLADDDRRTGDTLCIPSYGQYMWLQLHVLSESLM